MSDWKIRHGRALDELRQMEAGSAQTCVTSPPYWGLRDYGVEGQIGLEETPEGYIDRLVGIFEEVRRVLRGDGTLWLNLGDSYAGTGKSGGGEQGERWENYGADSDEGKGTWKPAPSGLKQKDLVGIPWRVAFALQEAGWWLRSDIIWHKPNPMPESVTDRPTSSHEYIFLLAKSERYYYDAGAIKEPSIESSSGNTSRAYGEDRCRPGHAVGASVPWSGDTRNKRDVWQVTTKPYPDAHFAVYPPDLIEPCILAGSAEGDTVLDPFAGAGTTGMVAARHGRDFVGIELNDDYIDMANDRIAEAVEQAGRLDPETADELGGQVGIFAGGQS